ncbi:sodium/potassium-transporting ATPase subunit beta-3-like [Bolinopsis microptera]|uniref:sodium/potassium-transporting ATPase subunit beta-3-like n=1 Tax=Bolinopsis microptera TaxID=2820187 RepID=UPI003079FD32
MPQYDPIDDPGPSTSLMYLKNAGTSLIHSRSKEDWGKLIIFYFFFYACLAAFFAVCLIVMLQTLDDDKPTVIGRTIKPKLAAPSPDLYIMNFEKEEEWNKYRVAADKLAEKYTAKDNKGVGFFDWSEANLGKCYNQSKPFNSDKDSDKVGCFYIGLNRIYNWTPEKKTLSFDCNWSVGKTGSGNLDPPFDMEMQKEVEIAAALKAYYPYTSKAENGLQPMQAIEITLNKIKQAAMSETDSLETYLDCSAYVNEKKIEDSGDANFEIRYSKDTNADE